MKLKKDLRARERKGQKKRGSLGNSNAPESIPPFRNVLVLRVIGIDDLPIEEKKERGERNKRHGRLCAASAQGAAH
jgi:hypothetical protein